MWSYIFSDLEMWCLLLQFRSWSWACLLLSRVHSVTQRWATTRDPTFSGLHTSKLHLEQDSSQMAPTGKCFKFERKMLIRIIKRLNLHCNFCFSAAATYIRYFVQAGGVLLVTAATNSADSLQQVTILFYGNRFYARLLVLTLLIKPILTCSLILYSIHLPSIRCAAHL